MIPFLQALQGVAAQTQGPSLDDVLLGYLNAPQPAPSYEPMAQEMVMPWQNPALNKQNASRAVQEELGARQPDMGGLAQSILAGRFESGPSYGDYAQSAINSLHGQYTPASDLATSNIMNSLKQINALSEIQKNIAYTGYLGSGGSRGGSTLMAAQALMAEDPNLDFATAFSIAKSGLGVGNTFNNGAVAPIPGAIPSASALEYGKSSGRQRAEQAYAAPIAQATAVGKAQGEIAGGILQKQNMANTSVTLTQWARELLPKATGSLVGAGIAKGKQTVGVSDESTQANTQLAIIGGQLVGQVPRFEGPQGVYDVKLYEKMAGRVGDATVPVKDRMAALDIIDALNAKYATQQQQSNLPNPTVATIGAGAPVNGPVHISGDEDYNRLPSGQRFVAPDGTIRIKP